MSKYTLAKRDEVLFIFDCDNQSIIRRTSSQVEEEAWLEVRRENIKASIKLKGDMSNDFNDSEEYSQHM